MKSLRAAYVYERIKIDKIPTFDILHSTFVRLLRIRQLLLGLEMRSSMAIIRSVSH